MPLDTPATPCRVCEGTLWAPSFSLHGRVAARCLQCQLVRFDRRQDAEPAEQRIPHVQALDDQRSAEGYCDVLERNLHQSARVLAATPWNHPFVAEARRRGHQVDLLPVVGDPVWTAPAGAYDAAIVILRLECVEDPLEFLRRLHTAVRHGGLAIIVAASPTGHRTQQQHDLQDPTHVFDLPAVRAALVRTGFDHVITPNDRHSRSSALLVTAQRATPRARPLLSIIMPAYNELRTFEATFAEVYAKRIPGIDTEIIVVESNSTDGTRAAVLRCASLPGVNVVLQDRPRGKGNAVREGLQHAVGDFVLIQDADREYDVDDYDALVEPLRRYKRAFVLGSRHTGNWKIRHFNTPGLAPLFNIGHLIFLHLFNVLYHQNLTDPFTMFKVFRRDCLDNVVLECDRFDFDFELVIKLVRQGYAPLEIPVNYTSRSFAEGKKVDAFRDPLTWIRALVKYRILPAAAWASTQRATSCSPEATSSSTLERGRASVIHGDESPALVA